MLDANLSFDKLSNEPHFVGLSFEKAAARRSALAVRLRVKTLQGFFDRLAAPRNAMFRGAGFLFSYLPFVMPCSCWRRMAGVKNSPAPWSARRPSHAPLHA